MPHKKTKRVQKKVHLGLQLDMASQRCLVADCGFCIATSSLAPLASRRGKNWKSECRPDMIQMIENHKFLMFFSWPLKSKIDSPRRRNAHFHSWVTRLPIEMNVHVANIFWRLLQIPAFCLLASKIRISNSSPLQGRRVNRLPCFSTSMLVWRESNQVGGRKPRHHEDIMGICGTQSCWLLERWLFGRRRFFSSPLRRRFSLPVRQLEASMFWWNMMGVYWDNHNEGELMVA